MVTGGSASLRDAVTIANWRKLERQQWRALQWNPPSQDVSKEKKDWRFNGPMAIAPEAPKDIAFSCANSGRQR